MAEGEKPIFWRRIFAGLLDFFFVFLAGGYLIAVLTGGETSKGFRLEGWPALMHFLLIVVYFVIFNRWLGGTLFKRIFGIPAR